jgi:hypothetical protein
MSFDQIAEILASETPVFASTKSREQYETTDGSSQIGRIISDLEEGWVLFGPCTGSAIRHQLAKLRKTNIPCDAEPDGPPSRIWHAKCGAIPSDSLSRAMADASMGNATYGEVYRSAGRDDSEVQQFDQLSNAWETVDKIDCFNEQLFEIRYLSASEASPLGAVKGIDVGKGIIAISTSE